MEGGGKGRGHRIPWQQRRIAAHPRARGELTNQADCPKKGQKRPRCKKSVASIFGWGVPFLFSLLPRPSIVL